MVVLGKGSPEMSKQGPGEGESGRMILRGETCLKRPKSLEKVSSPSEWPGSKDVLGKGDRQGWRRTLKGHLGKWQGSNQEGFESFKLWSMYGFKSWWSSDLRMTLGAALEICWKTMLVKTPGKEGSLQGQRLCICREQAAKSYLGGRLDRMWWFTECGEREQERRMGRAAAGKWSGQLASCWSHSPG